MRVGSKILINVVVTCLFTSVRAQGTYEDARAAVAQFEQGRALLAEGKYTLACAAFARSQQLDPQHGTLYNLANCYVKRQQLISAVTAYRDLAVHDRNPKRRADAARRAAELATKIPRLHITAPAGWTVKLNGVDVSGSLGVDQQVDPGAYEIVGTAAGEPVFRTTATVGDDGQVVAIAIRSTRAPDVVDPFDAHAADALPRPVISAHPAELDRAYVRDRRYAQFAIGGGAAVLATGLLFGTLARGKWHTAKAVCGGDLGCATQADIDRADALGDQARSRARVATGMVLAGAALGGAGAYFYWKLGRARVAPDVRATGAVVSVAGRF